ncbi:MAG: glycosyltransferase [Robiginitomaculum sp.]|nr:glycosyltransferase [Robiginitomaculum sp.]
MIETFKNKTAKAGAMPTLSVLVPYYHDDPVLLLNDLLVQAQAAGGAEILMYDDGTGDANVNARLINTAKKSTAPISLFFAQKNQGRSPARNYLKSQAKAKWVLFLDADMRPVETHFLGDYLAEINADSADIIFGGFTVPKQIQSTETELHRAFSQTSDCLSAEDRSKAGAQYVCSSNLCVRAKILDAEPFDTGFTGWGWEDSEWAARVAAKYRLKHADIPALHLGLESTDTLLSRFKNSGANYVRFTNAHPDLAKTLTLYRLSKKLGHVPGQKLMRPMLKVLVRTTALPTKIRLIALKLWRASWYAEVLT